MEHKHEIKKLGDGRLIVAVGVNVLLTVAQVIGGVISGSLSLVADALHNLSDAASLGIALFARIIGRKPPDKFRTFGYKRAEVIAALINLVMLVIIGLYLIYQAFFRFFEPKEIEGWTVVWVAGIALIIDVITAILTYSMMQNSMNIKAAFLHNVSDALSSIGVILAGVLILLYEWYWVDTIMTLGISGYVLWQGFTMLPKTIHLLMEGTPDHISIADVIETMESLDHVSKVHHVHVWQLDEHRNALEAHVVVNNMNTEEVEHIKASLKTLLLERFDIDHSTLEIELSGNTSCCED